MPLWAWLFFVLLITYGAFVQWRAWDKRHCCSKAEFQVDSSARRLADLPTEQGPNNRVDGLLPAGSREPSTFAFHPKLPSETSTHSCD